MYVMLTRTLLDLPEKNIIVIAIAAVAVLLIAFVIVLYFVSKNNEIKHIDKIEDLSSSMRIFVLDLENDTVRYFNRKSLKAIKTSSIIDFYNQFRTNDRIKVINWIRSLLDIEAKPKNYLEVNVLEKKRKKTCYSILQVQKVDYETKIIHLESFLLRLQNEKQKNRRSVSRFSSREALTRLISTSNSKKGATIAINFFFKNPDQRVDEFPRLVFAQIKNIVMNYVLPTRPVLEYNTHELIISDLKVQTKTQILNLVTLIKNDINKLLLISSHNEDIDYDIIIVENKYFPRDPEKIVATAVQIAEFALEEDTQQITWYEPGRSFDNNVDQAAYRTEVERIVRDNRLKISYRAIYNAEHAKTIGYEAFISPVDSFFESIEELKNYAIKTGDDKELFNAITKSCVSRFISEKDGLVQRLFYPITYKERHYVIRTLSYIQKIKETHLVICLHESDLVSMVDLDEEELIATLRSFKSKGYEVAIYLTNNEMPFSKKVYACFDFYLLDISQTLFDRNGNRNLSSLRGFAEKLIHYHKTIISTNIPNWDTVELMIRIGLAIVSSDSVAPTDEMILPISQKSIAKIKKVVQSQGDKYGK